MLKISLSIFFSILIISPIKAGQATSFDQIPTLHKAIIMLPLTGNFEAIIQLVQSGSDVNEALHNGLTPLHMAAQQGNCPLILLLLQFGADPTLESSPGVTPFKIAQINRHLNALLILTTAKKT